MREEIVKAGFLACMIWLAGCASPEANTAAVRESAYAGERNGQPYYRFVVEGMQTSQPLLESALDRRRRQLASACPDGYELLDHGIVGRPYTRQVSTLNLRVVDLFIEVSCK